MLFIDVKYLNLISGRLSRFKKKQDTLWNCRCPICGDSKKKSTKARGYFFVKEQKLFYKCHNCDVCMTFRNFLKHMDNVLYEQYNLEKFSNSFKTKSKKKTTTSKTKDLALGIDLPALSQLNKFNAAKKYVIDRKIPEKVHKRLYYAEDYAKWISKFDIDKKYSHLKSDSRLVIPIYSVTKKLVGASGRLLSDDGMRYVTCKWNDKEVFIYGLENWNPLRKTYVVEGPIDSMFLSNAIACMTSDLTGRMKQLRDSFSFDRSNLVLVYDNDKRNVIIQQKIKSAIEAGYNVCIWPKSLKEKDINEMILSNLAPEDITELIDSCTFNGLSAQMEFFNRSKINL
jgi:DNA primase